jgi:hypothetical protein
MRKTISPEGTDGFPVLNTIKPTLKIVNKNQIRAVWSGSIIAVTMLLFPPWKFTFDIPSRVHLEKRGPYTSVFSPPLVPLTSTVPRLGGDGTEELFEGAERSRWTINIDYDRLSLPLAAVCIVTIAVVVSLKNRK